MKRNTSRTGWTRVTVEIQTGHLAIARAIAVAITAEFPEEKPTTLEDVLSGALDEGLIEDEKFWLGTRSLDHTVRPWDTRRFPEMTRPVAALLKAVAS